MLHKFLVFSWKQTGEKTAEVIMCAIEGVRDKEIFSQKSLSQHTLLLTHISLSPSLKNERKKKSAEIQKHLLAAVGC